MLQVFINTAKGVKNLRGSQIMHIIQAILPLKLQNLDKILFRSIIPILISIGQVSCNLQTDMMKLIGCLWNTKQGLDVNDAL
jgi:hypothetical protein